MDARDEQAAGSASALRRRALHASAALLALALLGGLAFLLPWGEPVTFAQGVELRAASVSEETSRSQPMEVKLSFLAGGPLSNDALVFLHWSGTNGCQGAFDTAPAKPTRSWQAGQSYPHTVRLFLPANCAPGEPVTLFAGLYFPASGARLGVTAPESADDRVEIGTSHVVAEEPVSDVVVLSGRDFGRRVLLAPYSPWLPWLAAFALVAAFLYVARGARESVSEPESEPAWSARVRLIARALVAVPFLLGLAMVLEFIKDDAYISFRYAHNLVHGRGLVFNSGERLEGITNFLWTLLLAPFEALGLDLFQVCELLGAALGLATLACVARLTAFLREGRGRWGSELWGAFWLASSSSFVLYANSGLEQPLAAFLPCAGALLLYRSRALPEADETRRLRGYLIAGLLLGAGCLTRPELHLSALLVALPALVDVIRTRRLGRAELRLALGVLGLTAPAHLFRFLYYGSLIPNTFFVKTSSDSGVLETGLATLRDMFGFNATGLLLLLAPLAFLERRRTLEKLSCLAIALSFLVYYARVGVDEMSWHRLYIPALPFACALAASGAELLLGWLVRVWRLGTRGQLALAGVTWLLLAGWIYSDLEVTHDAYAGFNGHGDLAGTYHPDMGKFLTRHERPGGLVAFQDMGSTPYYAPDLNFLDFFGLVDKTVAHARHDHGLHTFITGDAEEQRAYDAEMRDYFFERNPEWTILTIYTSQADTARISELYGKDPTGAAFGNFYRNNAVQFGLWDDARFHQRYVPVRTWPRSSAYYLALWRRRDLWQQTPREVVLEAPPPQARGVRARFAGGLELLGSELTRKAPERHEAFVTSWWRLPGPMPRDLNFFVHFLRDGGERQFPADHVPGDWMYPADRWQAGQILEDRTLFQIPPETMLAGNYNVYLGAYYRDSGERLKIVAGANDGDDRVLLGTLKVTKLAPIVHALIPRTVAADMRAHPERITPARQTVAAGR